MLGKTFPLYLSEEAPVHLAHSTQAAQKEPFVKDRFISKYHMSHFYRSRNSGVWE